MEQPPTQKPTSPEWRHPEILKRLAIKNPSESVQEIHEHIFLNLIFDRLLDELEEEMGDADWTNDEITRFFLALEHTDDESIKNALAIPKELRPAYFARQRTRMLEEGVNPEDIARELVALNRAHGFTIGYHVSQFEIPPESSGAWAVKPTELDDRDDMPMAYYSLDYDHIYREKQSTHLYFVRAITGEGPHKRDLKNNWGRAPYLSIIGSMPLVEADKIVNQMTQELEKEDATIEGGVS